MPIKVRMDNSRSKGPDKRRPESCPLGQSHDFNHALPGHDATLKSRVADPAAPESVPRQGPWVPEPPLFI